MRTLDDILNESEALKPKLADAERELAQARRERDEARAELARVKVAPPTPAPSPKKTPESMNMTELCLAAKGLTAAR